VGTIGYRGVFWVAAIPGVLAIILVSALVRETGGGAPKKDRPILDFGPPAHLPPIFYFVLAAVTLFSIGNSSDMFLVLRAQDVGIPPTHAPLLGLVFNVVYTAASWPAGRWSDRASKPLIASAGYTVFAIVYLVFALAPSRSAIWAMMAFYGLFYALTNPVLRAMVAQTVAAESRGRAFGFYYFATSVAVLVSSIATGELWKRFGAELPFLISAGLAAVAAVMLIAVHRRFEHPHPAANS
jgi:predicted MFS family arabinose efflux permease